MNPIFIGGVLLLAVGLWFLLAFTFKPIGAFIEHIWGDAIDAMEDKKDKKEKEKENE